MPSSLRRAPGAMRVWARVDRDRFRANLRRVAAGTEAAVLAVVKADAYGHGAVEMARVALDAGAAMLGVGDLGEALALRQAGIEAPVLVLGALLPEEIEGAIAHAVTPTIHDLDALEQLERLAARRGALVGLHVKVDTGLGRLGLREEALASALAALKRARHLRLEGLCTHFARADALDDQALRAPLAKFRKALAWCRSLGLAPRWVHAANSAAIARDPASHFTLVRPGFALYGAPSHAAAPIFDSLAPVLSLHARIVHLKVVPAGAALGYGGAFVAKRAMRVATLSLGYADGYRRGLSHRADVLLRGRRCKVIGLISMDYTMVDVSALPELSIGEVATLIGRDGEETITTAELAAHLDTIPYEITCALGARVKRCYVGAAGSGGSARFPAPGETQIRSA